MLCGQVGTASLLHMELLLDQIWETNEAAMRAVLPVGSKSLQSRNDNGTHVCPIYQ